MSFLQNTFIRELSQPFLLRSFFLFAGNSPRENKEEDKLMKAYINTGLPIFEKILYNFI